MTPSRPCGTWARNAAADLSASLRALMLPGRCGACDRPTDGPLCRACLGACAPPAGPCCASCGAAWTRARRDGEACGRCRRFGRPWSFEVAAAMWRYRGPARQIVHAFKYGGRQDALAPLGALLAGTPRASPLVHAGRRALVVPVPARKASRKRRGYDQAVGLALAFAQRARLPCDPRALRRRREEGPQAGRSRRARRRQAAAAFRAVPYRVHGRRVVLLDDVLSTGATADAASRALLCAGALEVSVLTLAT
ncbi:MAG: ComF family protein [Planctomycetota bacterium]|jgi:ComF family protein